MVTATEHVRAMRGGAQGHLLRGSDQHYYVVKFVNNPQHRRVLANEWIAGRLARALGLPVPEVALVDVAADLIARTPEMVMRMGSQQARCAAGLQFGSRLPTADPGLPIYDYLPEAGLELVANLADFTGMILFDKWTCNCNGRQVVFCRPRPRARLRVYMIDQGFCFNAGDWTFPDSPLRGVYNRHLVYNRVTGWASFEPWLSRLEALDPAVVFEAGAQIPPDWVGDWDDLSRLLERLVQRRARVRELIWSVRMSNRNPFNYWNEAAAPAGEKSIGRAV